MNPLLRKIVGTQRSEQPCKFHVVVIRDGATRSEWPPLQTFVSTDSAVRESIDQMRGGAK